MLDRLFDFPNRPSQIQLRELISKSGFKITEITAANLRNYHRSIRDVVNVDGWPGSSGILNDMVAVTEGANPCLAGLIFTHNGILVFHSLKNQLHQDLIQVANKELSIGGFYGGSNDSRNDQNIKFYEGELGLRYITSPHPAASFSVVGNPIKKEAFYSYEKYASFKA